MQRLWFGAVAAFAAAASFAVDYTWTGAADNGKWKDSGNWSGGDAYPQSYVDTATFTQGSIEITDSPAQSGTVTLASGVELTIANGSTVDWKGLAGPGTLIKRGVGSLNVRNDVSGWCISGDAVVEVCEGIVKITTSGSEPARAPDYTGTDPTLGNCTFRMKGGAVEQYGWPTLYGTVTVECYPGVEANFLGATLRGCAGSKIVKTGEGTLNVLCKFDNTYTKSDVEVAAGEIAFLNGCDFSGTLSGSGKVSATPQLRLRADNTDFAGTIVLRNENDEVKLSHKFAAKNAAFDFMASTTTLSPDTYDVELHHPLAVPEGKTVNLSLGSNWTWIFGLSGPGRVVKTGTAGLVLLNRIADKTGAVDGNLKLEIDAGGLCFYSAYNGTSADDAVFGDATLTYHTAVTGDNSGWTQINGTLTVQTDYDVRLTSYGAMRGTGSIVKEGTGTLTIGGGLGDGSGSPFNGDVVVKAGKVVVSRATGTGNILGKIEGPGAFELQSGSGYTDRINGSVTAPFTCIGGNLEIKPGAEFADLALVDGARVKVLTLIDPLRVHGTLTTSGATRSVIDGMARAGSTGSLALVLADGAFDAEAFDYALPEGWTALKYPTRVFARTELGANFWTGGAKTTSWGDAANWADGVPSGSVILYANDVSLIDVPAGTEFGDHTVFLRGTGDVAFSGAGLGALTFSVDALAGKFVKRGTESCLSPKMVGTLDAFVVEEGVVRRAAQELAQNIIVCDGAQFDVNGVIDPSPMPVYTIAGVGPDGAGALVNTGSSISHDTSQMKGLVLSDDATIGGTAAWGFVNSRYAETTLDLAGHTLTKIGACDFWMTHVTALQEGEFEFIEGHIRFGDKPSDLSPVTLAMGDETGFEQRVSVDIGTLVLGANMKTNYGTYGWLNVVDELATTAPVTLYYLSFNDGSTFAPHGALTINTQATFGSNLTLALGDWTPASGKVLLNAPGVGLETFGTVTDLPENTELVAAGRQLRLRSTGGLVLTIL